MPRYVRLCAVPFLAMFSTFSTSQVLTKTNSGFATPETIQVTGHSNGNLPFSNLSSLSAQDVNGDGKIDLLVTGPDPTSSSFAVTTTQLRNSGSQNFQQIVGNNSGYCVPSYSFPATADTVPPFCVLADLNGDGLPDKIFAGEFPNTSNPLEVDYPYIKVQLATGAGTYAPAVKYSVGGRNSFISSVAIGDFNGDGRTDIALLRMAQMPDGDSTGIQGFVFLLLADGKGGFTLSHSFATGVIDNIGRPVNLSDFFPNMHLTSLDLNGDGKSDLIVYGSGFGVLLGTSTGLSPQPPLGPLFDVLVAADLNHDGFGDLVVAENASLDPQRRVHVLFGGGAGSQFFGYFARDVVLPLNQGFTGVASIVVGDFNRDGRPDIAVSGATLTIFLQSASGSFTLQHEYPTAGAFLVTADLNNDGKLDLVSAGNPMSILYGDGTGSFTGAPITSNFFPGAGISGNAVVTGDFNHDGKPDVVTTIQGPCTQGACTNIVSVFMGSGQGWFQPPKNYTVPSPPNILALGDVNGDGITDIVTLNTFGEDPPGVLDVGVLLGKADGSFLPSKSYTLGVTGVDLYLRDVNNDGKLDIVTDSGVALGKGDGTFSAAIPFPINTVVGCAGCQNIAVGDFNHDGKLDVLFARNLDIDVLIGNGTGHFSIKTVITPPCGTTCLTSILAVGDLNGDGKPDFVSGIAAGHGSGFVSYLGNGDGTFTLAQSGSVSASASDISSGQIVSVTIRDFNGDGLNDIAMQNTGGTMPVFLGNGGGKFTSPVIFGINASAQGSSAFAIADFNLNGTPDIAVPTINGLTRLLNSGFSTWPKLSSLPPPAPFRMATEPAAKPKDEFSVLKR